MTVQEAVQLVVQAGAIGRGGEALVLDMGKPVVIAEVARPMAARSDRHIPIEFTGLRRGEKLHEVLLAGDEDDVRPAHPLISHIGVPPLAPGAARAIDIRGRRRAPRPPARRPRRHPARRHGVRRRRSPPGG